MEPQADNHGGTTGRVVTVPEVMREIEKEVLFFDESGGGVTFSGGEPLLQHDFLAALLDECRQRDIHTTLDTTGYCSPSVFQNIINKVDLFLYDLKIVDEETHRRYTGVSNRLIKENLRTLAGSGKAVIIRFPVIPGFTDGEENIAAIGALITELRTLQQIDLLPYHRTAEAKYRRLNLEYRMAGVKPPSPEHMDKVKKLFEKYTHHVYINKE